MKVQLESKESLIRLEDDCKNSLISFIGNKKDWDESQKAHFEQRLTKCIDAAFQTARENVQVQGQHWEDYDGEFEAMEPEHIALVEKLQRIYLEVNTLLLNVTKSRAQVPLELTKLEKEFYHEKISKITQELNCGSVAKQAESDCALEENVQDVDGSSQETGEKTMQSLCQQDREKLENLGKSLENSCVTIGQLCKSLHTIGQQTANRKRKILSESRNKGLPNDKFTLLENPNLQSKQNTNSFTEYVQKRKRGLLYLDLKENTTV